MSVRKWIIIIGLSPVVVIALLFALWLVLWEVGRMRWDAPSAGRWCEVTAFGALCQINNARIEHLQSGGSGSISRDLMLSQLRRVLDNPDLRWDGYSGTLAVNPREELWRDVPNELETPLIVVWGAARSRDGSAVSVGAIAQANYEVRAIHHSDLLPEWFESTPYRFDWPATRSKQSSP